MKTIDIVNNLALSPIGVSVEETTQPSLRHARNNHESVVIPHNLPQNKDLGLAPTPVNKGKLFSWLDRYSLIYPKEAAFIRDGFFVSYSSSFTGNP